MKFMMITIMNEITHMMFIKMIFKLGVGDRIAVVDTL